MIERIKTLRPYLTVFRLRALMETQYRAAALGGLVTQVFFGLVYIFLYTTLYAGQSPEMLRDTITYVWLQQMFFRMLFSSDGELANLIMSGGISYMLVRPVDQHRFWVARDVGGRLALPGAVLHIAADRLRLSVRADVHHRCGGDENAGQARYFCHP